jgi:RNA polymerase-binding transcription factor DksA
MDDAPALDLDAFEAELAAVEASLERLDAGTYGRCEVTGAELPDDLLEADPTARRLPDLATS